MPELPEVETTRRQISQEFIREVGAVEHDRRGVGGPDSSEDGCELKQEDHRLKVCSVDCSCMTLRSEIPEDLDEVLSGCWLSQVLRRGKYMIFIFQRDSSEKEPPPPLLIHLGMSGWMCAYDVGHQLPKHSHVVFTWSNHRQLVYNDSRRFGTVDWCRTKKNGKKKCTTHNWQTDFRILKLGVEPLPMNLKGQIISTTPIGQSPSFTVDYFLKRARVKKIAIKKFLMDSTILVGVGNIYAAEALFEARIHPDTRVCDLLCAHWLTIMQCIQDVLTRSIKVKGTTFRDFKSGQGEAGYFMDHLKVYGRAGQQCDNKCGSKLINLKLGGRQTVCCQLCQEMVAPDESKASDSSVDSC